MLIIAFLPSVASTTHVPTGSNFSRIQPEGKRIENPLAWSTYGSAKSSCFAGGLRVECAGCGRGAFEKARGLAIADAAGAGAAVARGVAESLPHCTAATITAMKQNSTPYSFLLS